MSTNIKTEIRTAFEIIGKSFQAWSRNLSIIFPFLLQITLMLLIIIPYFAWIVYPAVADESLSFTDTESAAAFLQTRFTPQVIAVSLAVLAAVIIVVLFFLSGIIGMVADITAGKKPKFSMVFHYGKKFWLRVTSIFIISGLLLLVTANILTAFSTALSAGIPSVAIASGIVIGVQAFLFILAMFFVPAPYISVRNDAGVIASVKESFSIVKHHFLSFFIINAVMSALSLIMGIVPLAGGIIHFIILYPAVNFAFMFFVIAAEGEMKKNTSKTKGNKR